jgi:Protein of unknown function (DUF4058)
MSSPFPGMNPYIESRGLWRDFHLKLIYGIQAFLSEAAPDRYLVRTEERSYILLVEDDGRKSHPFFPDVSISKKRRQKASSTRSRIAVAEPVMAVEPIVMRAFVEEEHREAFVEIYEDSPDQRLVTSIEVLSPSNKRPNTPGWDLYLRKRQSLLLSRTSLVEIDLLRGGQRMPMLDPWPESPYTLLVSRATTFRSCKVWPAYFQLPLPSIPVPLAKPDPDIILDLQPMIHAIYKRSRYERSIDYSKPTDPPLKPGETTWLKKRLKALKA